MQTQSTTQLEQHWRVKSPIEQDYEYIVRNDQDRYPFMEKFMETTVTDTLKKTAKSYNKKSESHIFMAFSDFNLYRKLEQEQKSS